MNVYREVDTARLDIDELDIDEVDVDVLDIYECIHRGGHCETKHWRTGQ